MRRECCFRTLFFGFTFLVVITQYMASPAVAEPLNAHSEAPHPSLRNGISARGAECPDYKNYNFPAYVSWTLRLHCNDSSFSTWQYKNVPNGPPGNQVMYINVHKFESEPKVLHYTAGVTDSNSTWLRHGEIAWNSSVRCRSLCQAGGESNSGTYFFHLRDSVQGGGSEVTQASDSVEAVFGTCAPWNARASSMRGGQSAEEEPNDSRWKCLWPNFGPPLNCPCIVPPGEE